jgi:hypothetical protein
MLGLAWEGDIADVGTLKPFISLIGWSKMPREGTYLSILVLRFEWRGFQARYCVRTWSKIQSKIICRLPKKFGCSYLSNVHSVFVPETLFIYSTTGWSPAARHLHCNMDIDWVIVFVGQAIVTNCISWPANQIC